MAEKTESVSHARPRRGLPRRPEGNEAIVDGGSTQAMTADPVVVESAAAPSAAPSSRAGLPRPGEHATGSAPHASESATASQTGGSRRSGLVAKTAATAAPTRASTAPSGARRTRMGVGTTPIASLSTTPAAPNPAVPSAMKELPEMSRWLKIGIGVVGLLIVTGLLVLLARWLRTLEPVQHFLVIYPGETHLPAGAPMGLPAWLGWQHFLNAFFIVLIIRTGWQVRTQQRPPATWTRSNEGFIKTKNPPKKISLTLWAHLSLDFLWFVNGIVFVSVLFATGQWMRVVPSSWDVFPNAISALLQYLSMDWPVENGWVNYNSLQLLAYFTTIFIAAPLAAITGLRMSSVWPVKAEKLNKVYPMELARAIHFPVMLYFTLFVIMHVFLVFSTGALRNLNHMYASQDATTWTGFWIFFTSLLVMTGAVFAARPLVLAPIAQLMGRVGR